MSIPSRPFYSFVTTTTLNTNNTVTSPKMELELSRVDYTIVGITSSNCMRLLPQAHPQETQKVALADNDGIVQVFSIKKESVQIHFKTLPGPKISSLQLGGVSGTTPDKIFVASGNEVRSYTRKGKLFLSFESNMTESITSMFVLGADLFLCGKHMYNHYKDCKDIGSYLCGDRIIDVVAFQKSQRLISLIACEGRMIRALEHARVTMSIEVESAPMVLHVFEQDDHKFVLFGTVDGRIGLLDLDNRKSISKWLLNEKPFTSMITCMCSADIVGEGCKNLIVGRQDGNIEVYVIDTSDGINISATAFVHNCSESVTAVQCGIVGNIGYQEILVSTYTGRIFGLTTEPVEKSAGRNNAGSYIFSADTNNKITKLKNEIDDLKTKVSKERERYQNSTQSYSDDLSAIPLIEIKHSMVLSKIDSSYILTLEVPTPIDNVLLQSDVPVDLLDVEKNSAVVSYSGAEPQLNNFLLATYRCQINTNSLELKLRTIEGQYGTFRVYVTPLIQPKCCRLIEYAIKPLSHHMRIYQFEENRAYNILSLKGNFSLAEIHSWVHNCFPEVPEKPQIAEKTILTFQSSFLGTVVHCKYIKGEAEFKSDNISTVSVLKEFLTKEATKKKIRLDMSVSISDDSIKHTLLLIDPKLKARQSLASKISLLDALKELEITQEEISKSLSAKYRDLIVNEKALRAEYESLPSYLDRLYGIITDLFVDYYKFKAMNVKSKIPKLIGILDRYNYDELVAFFCPESG